VGHKDPEARRTYARTYAREHRRGLKEVSRSEARAVTLRTIEAVQEQLERVLAEVEGAGGDVFLRGRLACRILELALRAVEQGDVERRLADVEARLAGLAPPGRGDNP